jgi:hypothetical protein
MAAALRSLALGALCWAVGAAAAWAQALGAGEVRAALYGHDLVGEVLGTGEIWRECIDPMGRTWWRFGDFASEGRLEVRNDGQACFRYRHTEFREEACWVMREEEGRLRFDLVSGESLPLVILTRRRVGSCVGDAPIA